MQFSRTVSLVRHSSAVSLLLFLPVWSAFAQQPPASHSQPSTAGPAAGPAAAGHEIAPGPTGENLSSLSLTGSGLRAEQPVLGEKDEYPDFIRELIQVQWRDGDPIDLYVIRPRSPRKPAEKPPVVLYLYSYPSETKRFQDNRYCQRVTQDGFAAVGFVSALTGHRYHDRPMRKWFVSELPEVLVASVHDVQMILNYLSARGDLDTGRVGMFGQGSGATIAILAATVDPRIKVLDLLDPWGDWSEWMAKSSLIPEAERADYVKPEFLKQVASLDPLQWLPKLESRCIRLQEVGDDPITPEVCRRRIESAAPSSAKIVRFGDTRALYNASEGGRLFQWIKQHVGA
jgi:X-Pro dipeptidyl-peptidase (S15 family)